MDAVFAWAAENASAVQAVAAVVQAFAAIATVGATLVLVRITQGYARSAHAQVDEITRSSVQPYLHVDHFDISTPVPAKSSLQYWESLPLQEDSGRLPDLVLTFDVRNIGHGPAINVRAHIRHPWVDFGPTMNARQLDGGCVQNITIGPPREVRRGTGQHPPEYWLLLEYRDILGRWWATTLTVVVGSTIGPEGVSVDRADIRDQSEHVERIAGPRIRQETTQVQEWTPWTARHPTDELAT